MVRWPPGGQSTDNSDPWGAMRALAWSNTVETCLTIFSCQRRTDFSPAQGGEGALGSDDFLAIELLHPLHHLVLCRASAGESRTLSPSVPLLFERGLDGVALHRWQVTVQCCHEGAQCSLVSGSVSGISEKFCGLFIPSGSPLSAPAPASAPVSFPMANGWAPPLFVFFSCLPRRWPAGLHAGLPGLGGGPSGPGPPPRGGGYGDVRPGRRGAAPGVRGHPRVRVSVGAGA